MVECGVLFEVRAEFLLIIILLYRNVLLFQM
jgi:hypothetical protein